MAVPQETQAGDNGTRMAAVQGIRADPSLACAGLTVLATGATVMITALTIWIVRVAPAVPALDARIHAIALAYRGPVDTEIARVITWGGATVVALPALLVLASLAAVNDRYPARLAKGLIVAGVASLGVWTGLQLNAMVGRVRPPAVDWAAAAHGPSFPSGHTTVATIVALSAAWVLAARLRPGWPRQVVWVGAAAYALVVGWSRIWLGVHWPTDVLGGWLYGIAWCGATAAVVEIVRWRAARRSSRTHRS